MKRAEVKGYGIATAGLGSGAAGTAETASFKDRWKLQTRLAVKGCKMAWESLKSFLKAIFAASIKAYFFWAGFIYIVSGVVGIVGWIFIIPKRTFDSSQYVCPMEANLQIVNAIFIVQGVLALGLSLGYAQVEDLDSDDFAHLTATQQVIGFISKHFPLWSRLVHLFNFSQLLTLMLQSWLLMECNIRSLRAILGVLYGAWWFQIIYGLLAKRRIYTPPFLVIPKTPGQGFFKEVQIILKALGP